MRVLGVGGSPCPVFTRHGLDWVFFLEKVLGHAPRTLLAYPERKVIKQLQRVEVKDYQSSLGVRVWPASQPRPLWSLQGRKHSGILGDGSRSALRLPPEFSIWEMTKR